jgi:hypothetical protein
MKNEKLKLEEIVGYLPFWLNVNLFGRDYELTGITHETMYTKQGAVLNYSSKENEIKPILHPLKEIQNHIHKFSDKLCTYGSNDKFGGIDSASPEDYQLMYKLHLDVHNLIGRGLAIDINTLKL